MKDLIINILCASLRRDRQAMKDAKMAEHGYPQTYPDALECFGIDWEVDVREFERDLEYIALVGYDYTPSCKCN